MKGPYFSPSRLALTRDVVLGLAVRRHGPAQGPVLLYVHGLGESGLCFEDLLAERRLDHFCQLAPDLVGYGKSGWPDEPFLCEHHALKLAELLDALGIQRKVVLVGHSMGGLIGLHFSRLFPERLAGFLNVEGNISPADCTLSAKVAAYSLADFLDHGWPKVVAELHDTCQGPEGPHREANAVLRAYAASLHFCDPRTLHANSVELVQESAHEELATRHAAVAVPQLYLYGSPRGTGNRSRALLRQAGMELRKIPEAGHWPYLDQRAHFVDALLTFCARLGFQ